MYRPDFHLQALTLKHVSPVRFLHYASLFRIDFDFASGYKCRSRKSDIFDTIEFGHDHNERSWSSTFQILIQPCFDHLVFRYVDNSTIGFSLYRKDHLQTSVSQVFTDLDLSGNPVELELVFHCVLILPLTHWVSGPAFSSLRKLVSHLFIVQVSTFFQDHRCWKQQMICFGDIRPLCVGATPVPKGFHHLSNF